MLQAGVMDSMKGWQATEQGSPRGAVISPLLSNIYLNGLDWKMAQAGLEMVRYVDDYATSCDTRISERVESRKPIIIAGQIATSPRQACTP
jgi:RNA-directed DNA polymerase